MDFYSANFTSILVQQGILSKKPKPKALSCTSVYINIYIYI